jgi:hypothetical protein
MKNRIKPRKLTGVLKAIGVGFVFYSLLIVFLYQILFKLNPAYYINTPGNRVMVYDAFSAFMYIPHRPFGITTIPFYFALLVTGLIAGVLWKRNSTGSASDYESIGGGAAVGCSIAILQTIAGFIAWSIPVNLGEAGLLLYIYISVFISSTPILWWSLHAYQGWPFPTLGILMFFLIPAISAGLGAWSWGQYFAE